MRSYMPKAGEIERAWHLVDVEDKVLGRVASRVALVLMGKNKPTYTPHMDMGDNVVVVNCERIRLTGRKLESKKYYTYSGYPGGLREHAVKDVLANKPEDVLRLAVKRMLPKTRLGRQMIKKLKIYVGAAHPHEAQNPQPLELR